MNDQDGLELDKNWKYCKLKTQVPFLTEVKETESNGSDNKSSKGEPGFDIDSYDVQIEEEKWGFMNLKNRQ